MVLTLRPKTIPHSKQTTFDIDTYVDSDWAGCATSRRSTSGMALYFLGTLITSQSRTQATVALSSGEAELYAIGLGVSESLFIRSLLLESQLSKNVNIRIHTDSTAGKSMAILGLELPRRQNMFNFDFFSFRNLLLLVLFQLRRYLELRIHPM